MQTQTFNSLHNAIMEAGSKDRPSMLPPGNYIQWKSRIKRYIDTKPNRELIHFCLTNPPYELGWKEKFILDSEGNPTTATQQVFETYQNVKQEIRDQLNAEAGAVQIILTGIDNYIYSTVDACPNACEMWKSIERLKQGESINVQDFETNLFWEFRKFTSLDGESLESYYSRLYKLMNELTRNQCKVTNHQVNVQFLLQLQPEWHRCLKEEMVADLRYFNSLESKVDSLTSQLETQKTQFVNEIDRLSREYYYADHMNAILGVYNELDDVTNLQCDYLELPQLKSNPQGDRVLRSNSREKKLEVEEHRRDVKLSKNKTSVTACNDSLNAKTVNVKYVSAMCAKCVMIDKHDLCVPISVAKPLKKTVASKSNKKPGNNVRKLHERFGKIYKWSYIKFTPSGYTWKPKSAKGNVNPNLIEIVLFIVDSGCSKHMTGNLKLLINFVEKFMGMVKFRNDQIAPILGYGDLVQGAVTIKRVYYVEGLNHNLFSVGQFCDADLEVAFRKSTCFIHDLKGNDLLIGSHGTDLYSISLQSSNSPNLICLMAKATSSQAWLWHHRLSYLNSDTINLLSKNDIMVGLPELKFIKDHLYSSCELGKAKRKSFHTKLTPSSKRRLHLLHMDLCGPMRVESINGKRYVLVIVDDYSRYTWTHFLKSKDETPKVLIDFLRLVQRGLQAQIRVAYGIWETIVAKEGETTNEKKENTSKAIIFQTLLQDMLMHVAQYTTAKEVWNSIKVKHLGADLVQKARFADFK
nr:hypothetical protein [Tanacetum cinerariifolium]